MNLCKYERKVYTFEEELILREAGERGDWVVYRRIVFQALVRSMGIPCHLLCGDASYSSWRGMKR